MYAPPVHVDVGPKNGNQELERRWQENMRKAKPEISGAKQERPSAASNQPSAAAPQRRKRGRPSRADSAPPHAAVNSQPVASPAKTPTVLDLTEKAKELIRLAREQGHLTYEELHDE